jgi:glycosyltransferase involved in cell wall biosynthesis
MIKIATILPYKENYSIKNAGAVSLWVKDFLKFSKYKNHNLIYGNTTHKPYLSKNYKNIKINSLNSKFYSSTNEYLKNVINILNKNVYEIIEVHNRPVMISELVNKINSKYILYLHNDPRSMKGAKTPRERLNLLSKVDKIVFITKWVKEKFFENLNIDSNNFKCEIIYHSIEKEKKLLKKEKKIVFVGKLNESKGYDIFCDAVKKLLDNHKNWKAYSIGDEKRIKTYSNHPKHIKLGYMPHKKVLSFLNSAEIAVIPSRWEEPFGRTALEASSRGCATIISNRGGLPETTDEAIILKKLDSKTLKNIIENLINNSKLRKQIQFKSRKNIKHILKDNASKIDIMRESLFPFFKLNYIKNKLRILNVYNLGQKLNHRIYHISIGKKITNGFIRNKNDVLEISDRDFIRQNRQLNFRNVKDRFQEYLIETFKNYNPNLVIFGHSENIETQTLHDFKNINKNLIISQWNEDPMMNGLPDAKNNIEKINKFKSIVDHTFVTTDINVLKKNNVKIKNMHFLFIPVDRNIECFNIYNLKPYNDIFYAMSHGVNRATLKKGKIDARAIFLNNLVKKLNNINHDFYGMNNKEPIWGDNFFQALKNSKMGLNLSRGDATKYYSSNRIATLMGNGLLTFIDKKTKFDDFFKSNEIILYENINDLKDKIEFYKKNDALRKKIAKKGQDKYFKLFNETVISKYIIDASLGKKVSLF